MPCQTVERSKKSNVRAREAIVCTVRAERTSTPWTALSTRLLVRPSTWLARRSTVTASDTSPSTAATTSAVEGSPASNSAITRLRDSASIGKASSASKAAVRRRP